MLMRLTVKRALRKPVLPPARGRAGDEKSIVNSPRRWGKNGDPIDSENIFSKTASILRNVLQQFISARPEYKRVPETLCATGGEVRASKASCMQPATNVWNEKSEREKSGEPQL